MLNLLRELTEQEVVVVSLREGLDLGTPTGRAMAGIFSVVAELEHALIAERSQAARDALKARGGSPGRKKALDTDQVRKARALKAAGETAASICKTLGCGRSTLYRALSEDTVQAPTS